MIERINTLKNIGKFHSVSRDKNSTEFSELTLIYAENGRGKTTLANILRSLGTNDSVLIEERHRVNTEDKPHVSLEIDGQAYTYQNGAWNSCFTDIFIFDDNFVSQNVYSGIDVGAEHTKNLYKLILGVEGAILNTNLENYISQNEKHHKEFRKQKEMIPAKEYGEKDVDAFCALPENKNIDKDIEEKENDIAATKKSDEIKNASKFIPFSLPEIDIAKIEQIIVKGLDDVQENATKITQEHFEKLWKESEAWINEGVQKLKSLPEIEICPFCAESLDRSNILEHYNIYFDNEYTNLKDEIINFGKSFAKIHSAEMRYKLEQGVLTSIQTRNFWKDFLELPTFSIDTEEVNNLWKAASDSVLAILRAKLASPLEKMKISEKTLTAINAYNEKKGEVNRIFESLLNCNAQIDVKKDEADSANLQALEEEMKKLKATKARYSPDISKHCQAYLDEKEKQNKTKELYDETKNALDAYQEKIFTSYSEAINKYLKNFNAEFCLSPIQSHVNRGGKVCEYYISIDDVDVPLKPSEGNPSFKNSMSAGDRNTLALAFFFASLEQDDNRSQKIVVIDDPMTSLDEHRTDATVEAVGSLLGKVKQLIILSHSKPFLCQIWENNGKNKNCAIEVIRSGEYSVLEEWNVDEDCITEHDKRHKTIQGYVEKQDSSKKRKVATELRYVLESFLRVAYPEEFPPNKMLGGFLRKCNDKINKESTPILHQQDIETLESLKKYANKFHHDTNPDYRTVIINDQELLSYCKKVLAFTRRPSETE